MNYQTYSLGIDEIRYIIKTIEIKDSSRKPINISFYTASDEAQSAMLKMLEDHEDTQFIINVPYADLLLPTVRSRLIDITSLQNTLDIDINTNKKVDHKKIKGNLLIINSKDERNNLYKVLVNKYIGMPVSDRLKCKEIVEMLDKEVATGLKNKEIKSKDSIHQFLITLINRLIDLYKEEINTENTESKKENLKEQINQFNTLAQYMIKPGSSAKLIMDYVAYRLKV